MATLAETNDGTLSLRERIDSLADRVDRAKDTVACSETPPTVPWPTRRSLPNRSIDVGEPVDRSHKLELLGRMAASVAHDLNNLLAVIGGHAELLAMKSLAKDPLHFDVIQSSIRIASQLTGRLLTFSKPETSFEIPVLDAVVRESEPLLRSIAGSDVECIVLCDGGGAKVLERRDRIEQILLNLVANARDALTVSGVIAVRSSTVEVGSGRRGWPSDQPSGIYAVLSVADNGRGMDAATAARIFEPYFTTRGDAGTGLGLATVREIVDRAGGHIELETAPGRGSIFRVYLPAEEFGDGIDRSIQKLLAESNGRTALLVDDDESLRSLAKVWLESAGYNVIEARNGEEAIRLSRVVCEPIDVLVADFVMPGLGGRRLAERLRSARPGLPIVHISGHGNPYEAPEPGVRFVAKPMTRLAFLEAVEQVSRTVALA